MGWAPKDGISCEGGEEGWRLHSVTAGKFQGPEAGSTQVMKTWVTLYTPRPAAARTGPWGPEVTELKAPPAPQPRNIGEPQQGKVEGYSCPLAVPAPRGRRLFGRTLNS